MRKKNLCHCSSETEEEKLKLIDQIVDNYKNKEGSLIQILHLVQGVYGYLPLKVQEHIAKKLNKPLSEIYGVTTFYSFFSTKPRGKYTIRVCLGTACYVRGGKKIVERLKDILSIEPGETTADGKFTFEIMRCIGACGLAPAITINDRVYKQVSPDRLKQIISNLS
ncbi:MAG: NAD(P)H-dependent oxidoreductase subunit E [Brevinematales bacterium]|nr:NAD(P)H-dependent oxidoreductase subunit E [Brevinematales bacterium]